MHRIDDSIVEQSIVELKALRSPLDVYQRHFHAQFFDNRLIDFKPAPATTTNIGKLTYRTMNDLNEMRKLDLSKTFEPNTVYSICYQIHFVENDDNGSDPQRD